MTAPATETTNTPGGVGRAGESALRLRGITKIYPGTVALEDVALDVGIRRPSIVYYFPGKQQLYDEIEADIFASMHSFVHDRMTGIEEPKDWKAALKEYLDETGGLE